MLFFLQPLFAFLYKEQFPVNGWKVYEPILEYKRQVKALQLCMQDLALIAEQYFLTYLENKLIMLSMITNLKKKSSWR